MISLSLISVVTVGLIIGGGSYIDSRSSVATANSLDETGQQLSQTVMSVDRLVRQSDSDGEIGQQIQLPESIEGDQYTISVVNRSTASSSEQCDRQCLILETEDVTRTVYFSTKYPVQAETVRGGPVYVTRPDGGDAIVLNTTATQ